MYGDYAHSRQPHTHVRALGLIIKASLRRTFVPITVFSMSQRTINKDSNDKLSYNKVTKMIEMTRSRW